MKHWNVGDLVDALEKAPRGAYLDFEWGRLELGGWEGYRGYYDRIALYPATRYEEKLRFVGTALDALKADLAAQTVFEGYKGGDYPFARHRLLHVATHGNTSSTVVTGLDVRDWGDGKGIAHILTSQEPD